MPKFLIEVEHEPTTAECNRAIAVFLRNGSHFLTHADWGCKDSVHKAWFTADFDSKREALSVVPAEYQAGTRIVQLTRFTMQDLDKIAKDHGGNRGTG